MQVLKLEKILDERADQGKLFHPNKIFIPCFISKSTIYEVVEERNNFEVWDYSEIEEDDFFNRKGHEITIRNLVDSSDEGE